MPVSGDQDIIEKRSPGFSECADIGESGGFFCMHGPRPQRWQSGATTTSEVAIKGGKRLCKHYLLMLRIILSIGIDINKHTC